MSDTLNTHLTALATLLAQAAALAAPFDTQIHALQVARADALHEVNWQIDNLKAVLKPLVLAEKRTVKTQGLVASYVHKESWNDAQLRAFALEHPAVLQCLMDSSYVAFRYHTGAQPHSEPG